MHFLAFVNAADTSGKLTDAVGTWKRLSDLCTKFKTKLGPACCNSDEIQRLSGPCTKFKTKLEPACCNGNEIQRLSSLCTKFKTKLKSVSKVLSPRFLILVI